MQRIRDAYKRPASSDDDDDDEAVFTTPKWIAPMTKRSRARMMKYKSCKTCETSGDVDYAYEAFTRPAVKAPVISQPRDADSIESPASPPPSSQPEGCPLTQPEDDGSDSSESESSLPVMYVLPDTTVIVSPHDTAAVFKPRTPNEDMTQEVCDIIIEEVIGRKITLELQNSRLSLETTTHNVCQDVAVAITSTDWQKEVRRHLQLHSK